MIRFAVKIVVSACLLCCSVRAQECEVLNYASGKPEIAPEALARIVGLSLDVKAESAPSITNLLFSLAGTTVTVEGRSAPLLYVSPSQIVFKVPKMPIRLAKSRVTVTVNAPSEEVSLKAALAYVSPGIMCFDAPRDGCAPQVIYRYGAGTPYVIHQGFPVGLSDIHGDAVAQFYGSGFRRAQLHQVEMKLCGEMPMDVVFVGPSFIDGIDVLAVKLPDKLPASCPPMEQPITLTIVGKTSNSVLLNLKERNQ